MVIVTLNKAHKGFSDGPINNGLSFYYKGDYPGQGPVTVQLFNAAAGRQNDWSFTDQSVRYITTSNIKVSGDNFPEKITFTFDTYTKTSIDPSISGGSGSIKKILGRDRKIVKVGRKSMITYKGVQISLAEARTLEKKIASSKHKA